MNLKGLYALVAILQVCPSSGKEDVHENRVGGPDRDVIFATLRNRCYGKETTVTWVTPEVNGGIGYVSSECLTVVIESRLWNANNITDAILARLDARFDSFIISVHPEDVGMGYPVDIEGKLQQAFGSYWTCAYMHDQTLCSSILPPEYVIFYGRDYSVARVLDAADEAALDFSWVAQALDREEHHDPIYWTDSTLHVEPHDDIRGGQISALDLSTAAPAENVGGHRGFTKTRTNTHYVTPYPGVSGGRTSCLVPHFPKQSGTSAVNTDISSCDCTSARCSNIDTTNQCSVVLKWTKTFGTPESIVNFRNWDGNNFSHLGMTCWANWTLSREWVTSAVFQGTGAIFYAKNNFYVQLTSSDVGQLSVNYFED